MKKGFLIIILFFCSQLYSQEESSILKSIRVGTSYDFEPKEQYKFSVLHYRINFSLEKNNNELYFGPQYTYIVQPKPVASIVYDNNAYGGNIGYRRYSGYFGDNSIRLFGQIDFSLFSMGVISYGKGPNSSFTKRSIEIENSVSLGLDFNISDKISLNSGVGFGSFDNFFLMFNSFALTTYMAINIQF